MAIQVLVERGCSNRSIARQLGGDEKAVRYRRARLEDGAKDGRAGKPFRAEAVGGVIEQWVSSREGVGVNLQALSCSPTRAMRPWCGRSARTSWPGWTSTTGR